MKHNTLPTKNSSIRRLVVIGVVTGLLLLCLGILSYAFLLRQRSLATTSTHPTLPGYPVHPLVSCTTPPHSPGESMGSIVSGGVQRTFLLHLPPSYGKQALPLVISYHGYSWTSQIMKQSTHMDMEADRAGFVLVWPQGLDSPPTWNAGDGTGDADDVQFSRDLLTFLEKTYCVDAQRVYVTGFSLGGGMAYRVACALAPQIAALATISGAYYPIPGGCQPARPLPVLEIHGAADDLAPYAGNPTVGMAAVHDYLQGWLSRDTCVGEATTFLQQGDVTGLEWTHCAAHVTVEHYRISDGKHIWPTTNVIDPNAVIWKFFSRFAL